MDPRQITCLAKLLKDGGDKVLNSEFKLSLSGCLLRALNDSFSLIVDKNEVIAPQTFQVVKPNNAKSDVFRDLQFIYDFVQKTITLSLNQYLNDDPYEFEVDITKFRNLRKLEIQKIPINQVIGIQQLRAQLQELVCVKSISNIKDIITSCGGDDSNGFVWNELRTASFSYNMLDYIDNSLEFTPWLENLNLSHNQIVSVSAVKWLPNLKILNLSFNRLTHVPTLHVETIKRLRILLISNNFIEDLSGISRLDSLNELDVSGNCVIDHSTLLPLSTLASLCYLNLLDNPISCHPKHRQATARYLHSNTSSVKFVLDNAPLSKFEKSLTGNYDHYHPILKSRLSASSTPTGLNTPNRKSYVNSPSNSFGSRSSLLEQKDEFNLSGSTLNQSKRIKVRKAVISENKDEQIIQSKVEVHADKTNIEGNREHLDTKKQIEDLRKKFGSEWLQSQAGTLVKNVIGFDPSEQKYVNVLQYEGNNNNNSKPTVSKNVTIEVSNHDNSTTSMLTSTPIDKSSSQLMETLESPIKNRSLNDSDFKSVCSDSDTKMDTVYKSVNESTITKNSLDLDNIYTNTDSEAVPSEAEDNEVSYIVKAKETSVELYLIISDISIREKDCLSGKTKTRWGIKTFVACERPKADTITLLFDTIKKDKKERCYEISPSTCQKLEFYLRDILSKRPLSEMNQRIYKCVVCNAKFSREVTPLLHVKKVDLKCPECNRGYCIEIKESPPKLNVDLNQPSTSSAALGVVVSTNQSTIVKSESKSSIATLPEAWRSPIEQKLRSAGSLNDSSSCSKISQPGSSFDSNQSVAGSTNSERDRDVDLLGNDSDIEILSNPSQSSIEVLDRGCTLSRKYSEERRISQAPDLDTIDDNSSLKLSTTLVNQVDISTSTNSIFNKKIIKIEDAPSTVNVESVTAKPALQGKKSFLSAANLTESSSSGSVTDSVCTAYESAQDPKPASSDENPSQNTPVKTETSVISSMLGGLFQSTNLLMSKTPKKLDSPTRNLPFEPMKYVYTDFSNVDHRLKLFLCQIMFEDAGETLKWLVSCIVFDDNQIDEWPNGFDGLFVMSTTKFYVLKKIAAENDDPSTWLKKHMSGTVDRVGIAQILPWKIGIRFSIKGIGNMHIILQDILRTDSMILFFADNPLPEFCSLEYQAPEILTEKLTKTTDGKQVKILMVINFCEILSDDELKTIHIGTLLLTDSHLYLASNLKWLNENSKYQIEPNYTQLMTNLVELENINELSFKLNFMDENEDKFETWRVDFATKVSKENTLTTISHSWEKIFGVPLINNSSSNSNNNN